LLGKAADLLNRVARPISEWLHIVGVSIIAVMMFLTAGDVTGRYVFSRPITGAFDITQYMMAIVFAFTVSYCAITKGHVSVDFVVDRLSTKVRAIINCITTPLALVLFAFVTWQNILYIKVQFDTNIASAVLLIPRFPFVALLAIGFACLTLVLLAGFLTAIYEVTRR
jgi:TRAP-type C4-dicarboxylate transport system permease small subunit